MCTVRVSVKLGKTSRRTLDSICIKCVTVKKEKKVTKIDQFERNKLYGLELNFDATMKPLNETTTKQWRKNDDTHTALFLLLNEKISVSVATHIEC